MGFYGTRDVAPNWQSEFIELFRDQGVAKGRSSLCDFHNPKREVTVTVHGDDFIAAAPAKSFTWFKHVLGSRHECKHKMLDPDFGHESSIRVPNRVISWCKEGMEHEAGQRHCGILIKQLMFEDAKFVVAPGDGEERNKAAGLESSELMSERCQRIQDVDCKAKLFGIGSS